MKVHSRLMEYMEKMMENETTKDALNGLCPRIANPPSKDCYCVKLTSQCIEMTIYYCGNNFHKCEIYKSLSGSVKKP